MANLMEHEHGDKDLNTAAKALKDPILDKYRALEAAHEQKTRPRTKPGSRVPLDTQHGGLAPDRTTL